MTNIVLQFEADRSMTVPMQFLRNSLYSGDAFAHEFRVKCDDLAGCTVKAFFVKDGQTIHIGGTVSGDDAVAVLTPECYNSSGYFQFFMRLERNGVRSTILAVSGIVRATT